MGNIPTRFGVVIGGNIVSVAELGVFIGNTPIKTLTLTSPISGAL